MKLPILFILISSLIFGQNNTLEFEITTYVAGEEYRKEIQSIEGGLDKLDLRFMRKHFSIPHYLPNNFVNKDFKNETIIVWNDVSKKDDYTANWTNTYKYDSQSKVTEYSYSGCISCSSMPYKYKVKYNDNTQVILLENTIAIKDSYEISYDENGEITKLKSCSSNGEMKMLIETLK